MRFVFIFAKGVPLGGMETSTLRLARGLAKAGQDVLLLIHGAESACHPLLMSQVKGLPHAFLPAEAQGQDDEMVARYAASAPAVVFPNQSAWAYSLLRAAKESLRADLHIYGICHSDHPDYYGLAVENQDIVDVQFGVSRHMCEELDRRLTRPSRLIILGVEVPETYPERPPHKRLELLYSGRIENYGKRCCELIPAGEALRKRGVDFRLTIAGDGPYLKWLTGEDLKKVAWWRRGRYRILGAVSPDRIGELYRASDIYLSFTRFEGNSIAVMEAMANGCVPVIPRVSGTETVVEQGVSGWLGVVDQPETLISACEKLCRDRDLLRRMSHAAWEQARVRCSIQQTVASVLDLAGTRAAMTGKELPG